MKKRKKHVFDTGEIPHLWAHRTQDEARNRQGNLYFTGDTIYSYGSHFPIARHVTNDAGERAVLFTTATYSVTPRKPLLRCSFRNSLGHSCLPCSERMPRTVQRKRFNRGRSCRQPGRLRRADREARRHICSGPVVLCENVEQPTCRSFARSSIRLLRILWPARSEYPRSAGDRLRRTNRYSQARSQASSGKSRANQT